MGSLTHAQQCTGSRKPWISFLSKLHTVEALLHSSEIIQASGDDNTHTAFTKVPQFLTAVFFLQSALKRQDRLLTDQRSMSLLTPPPPPHVNIPPSYRRVSTPHPHQPPLTEIRFTAASLQHVRILVYKYCWPSCWAYSYTVVTIESAENISQSVLSQKCCFPLSGIENKINLYHYISLAWYLSVKRDSK